MTCKTYILIALIGLCARPGHARAQSEITRKLRAGIARDEEASPGQQDIRFGPMKDGRELSITTHMVNNSSAVNIQGGRDIFVIRMGRNLQLESLYVEDATIVCAHFPDKVCNRMAAYIGMVARSPSPKEAPFIEEAFPDLLKQAEDTRADQALYNASLLAGMQSLAGMITLHEIAHAALKHLDGPTPNRDRQIEEEGEADGFAAYVAKLAKFPPAGATVALMLDAVQETRSEGPPLAHPPAICRVGITMQDTLDWIQGTESDLLRPSDNMARDKFARDIFDHVNRNNQLRELDASWETQCKRYALSFANGVAQAKALVDQNTQMDSAVLGQK